MHSTTTSYDHHIEELEHIEREAAFLRLAITNLRMLAAEARRNAAYYPEWNGLADWYDAQAEKKC